MSIFVLSVTDFGEDEDEFECDKTLEEFAKWFVSRYLSQYERHVMLSDNVVEIRISLPFGAFVDYVIEEVE